MDPITLAVLLGIASGAAAVGLATNTAMRRMRKELDDLTADRDTAVRAYLDLQSRAYIRKGRAFVKATKHG